jgi:hypothetical protein
VHRYERSPSEWWSVHPDDLEVELVIKETGTPVQTVRTSSLEGPRVMVRLVPTTHLPIDTLFEIVGSSKFGSGSLGTFRTGKATDTLPPRAPTLRSSKYQFREARCCDCSTGEPYAVFGLKPVESAAWYGIWASRSDTIDYERPADAYVHAKHAAHGYLELGYASHCYPTDFKFPKDARLRVGIRALDTSGNASPPAERRLPAEPTTMPSRSESIERFVRWQRLKIFAARLVGAALVASIPLVVLLVRLPGDTREVSGVALGVIGTPRKDGHRLYMRVRLDSGKEVRALTPGGTLVVEGHRVIVSETDARIGTGRSYRYIRVEAP